MRTAFIVLALAALAEVATVAHAQEGKDETAARADDVDASSVGTASLSRIVLEAGDADSKATARLASRFGGDGDIDGRYALTVSAPFDSSKADRVDIGTLSGLTAGTSATIEFGLRWWPSPTSDQQKDMKSVCEKYFPLLIPGYSWCDVTTAAAAVCDADALSSNQLDQLIKRINERRKSCAKCRPLKGEAPPLCETFRNAQQQSCVPNAKDGRIAGDPAACAVLEKYVREECAACKDISAGEDTVCPVNPEHVRAIGSASAEDIACRVLAKHEKPAALVEDAATRDALLAAARAAALPVSADLFRPLSLFTVGLTANTQRFTYLLEDNLDKVNKNDKKGYGITVAATHVLQRSAWTLGYSHEESYEGTDKIQLCRPLGTTDASTCTTAALGAPKKEKAEIAFLQNRVAFADGRFALAPRVEFDFKESEWAARVPFYFIVNGAQELTAGIALGYSEADDEELGATVFISKAFTFY